MQLNSIIEDTVHNTLIIQFLKETVRKYNNMQKLLTIRVSLKDFEDIIWRTMEVPATLTLSQLSYAIMSTMKCDGMHLYNIKYKNQIYDGLMYDKTSLLANDYHLYDFPLRKGSHFLLTYDFGDNFKFDITIQEISKKDCITQIEDVCIIDGKGYGIWEDMHREMISYYYCPQQINNEDMEMIHDMASKTLQIHEDNKRIIKDIKILEEHYNTFFQ